MYILHIVSAIKRMTIKELWNLSIDNLYNINIYIYIYIYIYDLSIYLSTQRIYL